MLLGALAGLFASQFLQLVWYSRFLFGSVWCKYAFPGTTTKKPECNACACALSFVAQTTMVLLLSYIMPLFQIECVSEAAQTGLGLAALISIADIPHVAFNTQSMVVFLIDHAYNAAVLALMCSSITYFK